MQRPPAYGDILTSAFHVDGVISETDVLKWFKERSVAHTYSIQRVPLDRLQGWRIDSDTGNVCHSSGKFFSVEGLEVQTNFGTKRRWAQPIINQPEVGILGFIAKRLNGVLHLLVQAKMEPGNINVVQISPTVQATRSNYTQVHGGRRPPFVDYFLGCNGVHVLADQLQSEQGTRYLRKRNRNVIVQVPDDEHVPHSGDFIWLTIGQLQRLMRFTNLIHLDCRSILGSLSFDAMELIHKSIPHTLPDVGSFGEKVLGSLTALDAHAEQLLGAALAWLSRLKCIFNSAVVTIPLNRVIGWRLRDGIIQHESGCFFSVVGVAVQASSREVTQWHQPLIHSKDGGIVGLVTQMRNGVLHFLIQARAEPGYLDIVELAPTVQCIPANYQNSGIRMELPAFVELFQPALPHRIRFDSVLSEEGGRFYHSQQRHTVLELEPDLSLDVPDNYCWMTLRQIQECARFSNLLNIELRSILACVSPAQSESMRSM